MENTAGFTPAKLVSGLYQAFVFRISEQIGHLVGIFVIETGILSIAGNDDIGPISATLQQIVTIVHLQKEIKVIRNIEDFINLQKKLVKSQYPIETKVVLIGRLQPKSQ